MGKSNIGKGGKLAIARTEVDKIPVYLSSIMLLAAYSVLVLRIIVRRDYLQKGKLTPSTAILQALIFFAFGGFPILYLPGDWPATNVPPITHALGLTSLTIGIVVMLVGILRLGIRRSFGLKTETLKSGEFYRLTRNPQVLGCVLYIIGFVILWPSWFALGWGLSLIGILHVMVLTEEEHLRNAYGQDYEQYCLRVPRYLGISKKPGGARLDEKD